MVEVVFAVTYRNTFCEEENDLAVALEFIHRYPQRKATLRTKSQKLAHLYRVIEFLDVTVNRRRGLLLKSPADGELQRAAAPNR